MECSGQKKWRWKSLSPLPWQMIWWWKLWWFSPSVYPPSQWYGDNNFHRSNGHCACLPSNRWRNFFPLPVCKCVEQWSKNWEVKIIFTIESVYDLAVITTGVFHRQIICQPGSENNFHHRFSTPSCPAAFESTVGIITVVSYKTNAKSVGAIF